jgi:hypothetical protein
MDHGSEPRWKPFRDGTTLGEMGSEAGVILRDEEHVEGARITLERPEPRKPFRQPIVRYAITCGVYDWMVHTRFFAEEADAVEAYEAMKPELAKIAEALPEIEDDDPDVGEKVERASHKFQDFTQRFP